MRRVHLLMTAVVLLLASGAAAAAGCSSNEAPSTFDVDGGGRTDGSAGGADGGGGVDADIDTSFGSTDACVNLACQQVACGPGGKTTVSGTVYDPAGKVPLYNVIVYVPNAPLGALASGAVCDKCGAAVSGSPVAITLTDAAGKFVLENVPVGADIPLVMQVGKWRRKVTLPSVAACTDTPVADRNVSRLPRNKAEGDIPQIAISTGGADPLECLLRKVGIDDAEFTTKGGAGRIHLYAGGGYQKPSDAGVETHDASNKFAANVNAGAAFAQSVPLWSSVDNLKAYDVVLLACEGQLNPSTMPETARQALYDYESQGGRVFASHWHEYWFSQSTPVPALPTVGSWHDQLDPGAFLAPPGIVIGTVDTSFPKGAALSAWLQNAGATTSPGQLPIKDSKHNLDAVNPAKAQRWISAQNPNASPPGPAVQYMTFNTPLDVADTNQCGRVVFSDLHVSSGDSPGQPFPSGCTTVDLSPQEKALEFMLFDLSSCVQSDNRPPSPPPK